MKAISLIIIASLAHQITLAEIRNGYQGELIQAEQGLHILKQLIQKVTPDDNEERIYVLKSHYLRVKRTNKRVSTYYQKTEELITLLSEKYPAFSRDLHQVRNYYGVVTDIYIRVIPEEQMKHKRFGTTNLQQADDDPHIYQSKYGRNTVSIQIRECSPSKELKLLVHELAHVNYQVPNLATYMEYYQQTYQGFDETAAFGHLKDDPSNQSVIQELNTFHMKRFGKKLRKSQMLALGHEP